MNTDPIADFLIRIKNAGYAKQESVSVPFSNMKLAIAEILNKKGFIGEIAKKGKTPATKSLTITLVYNADGSPRVTDVKRISKPSRRLYEKAKNIASFKSGFGMTVFSTPKGIMADQDAKKENLGGEILFSIW
jgi:small subunit ribosomal protein S8